MTLFCTTLIIIEFVTSQTFISTYWDYPKLTWLESNALCLFNFGSPLASIHNEIENTEANSLCPDTKLCWIGAYDVANNSWQWIDGTAFDYGTVFGSTPWKSGEPSRQNEKCLHLWYAAQGWNDNICNIRDMELSICNYPQFFYIANGSFFDLTVPQSDYLLGSIDILDEIIVQFNFVIYSWHSSGSSMSLLHIGENAIYINGTNSRLYVSFSTINQSNAVLYKGPVLMLNTSYIFELHSTQNNLLIKLDEQTMYNISNLPSHPIVREAIYLSDGYYNVMDGYISNLIIKTTNSYLNPFNYLCDYPNRFTEISGIWSYNRSNCNLQQLSQYSSLGTVAWLGDKDSTSLNWTDYKIEARIKMSINSPENAAGILIRCQSMKPIPYGANCYYIDIHAGNKLRLIKIYNESILILIAHDIPINYTKSNLLRVEANGNRFDVYFNNQFMFNHTESQYLHGSIGLRTYKTMTTYSSLRIILHNTSSHLIANPTMNPTVSPTINPTVSTSDPSVSPTLNPSIIDVSSDKPTYGDGEVFDVTDTTSFEDTHAQIHKNDSKYSYTSIIILAAIVCFLIFCLALVLIIYFKKKRLLSKQNTTNMVMANSIVVSAPSTNKSIEMIETKNNNEKTNGSNDLLDHTQHPTTKGIDYGNNAITIKSMYGGDINGNMEENSVEGEDDDDGLWEQMNTNTRTGGGLDV